MISASLGELLRSVDAPIGNEAIVLEPVCGEGFNIERLEEASKRFEDART
ncbi:MAG: hypothetical protein AAF590_02320 [Pseudomonadota bacterium]